MAIEKTINIDVNSKKAQKDVKDLEKSIGDVNKEVKNTSESSAELTGRLDNVTGGAITKFKGLKGGLKSVINSFKSLKVAIIGTGIGALLIAVVALGQAFTRSEEGQNKFQKILGIIGSVVDNLLDGFASLGEGIISAFENPEKAWNSFTDTLNQGYQFIKKQIIDRFQGGWAVLSGRVEGGILKMRIAWNDFTGDSEEAETLRAELEEVNKKVVEGVQKISEANKAVVEVYESAKDKIKEFTDEVVKDATAAGNIADKRAKADKLARDLTVQRAEADRKIAELREKAADKENVTAAERIELLKEAGAISQDLANKETEVARLRLEAKTAENALAKSNKQDLDEEAQLKADLINKETQRLKLQKALTAEVTTALREEAAETKAAEAAKKVEEDKKIKAETDRLNAIKKIRDDFAAKIKEQEAETELEKLALEEEKKLAELDRLDATEEQKLEILKYYAGLRTDLEEKENKKKEDLDKLRKQQILGDAKNTFNQIANLAGKDSKVGKALALASATISGVEGVQNAYSTAQKSPITAVFPAYPVVQAALAAAVAAKNIATIKKTDPTGKGAAGSITASGGAGGGGAAPSFNVVGATDTNQLADAISGQTQQPVQAYVVANDVTSAQSLDRNIVEGASL
jgi:hypothetical protein